MKKYQVTRKNYRCILEQYDDMSIDELEEFLQQFVGEGTLNGYVYANEKELEEDIKYIKEYGEEQLMPWDNFTEKGFIEISEVKNGTD